LAQVAGPSHRLAGNRVHPSYQQRVGKMRWAGAKAPPRVGSQCWSSTPIDRRVAVQSPPLRPIPANEWIDGLEHVNYRLNRVASGWFDVTL
jgi:hypothetical protein